jgi:all-trans-retinol dehydrogenase (NAD+)
MTDVRGRRVLITGGASGIGRLLAGELGKRGARLVLWDLDPAALDSAVTELRAAGVDAEGHRCDVSDRAAVYALAAQVGDIDVLVNNAGIVSGRPLLEIPDEQIEKTFAVNTLALYWTTKAFLPGMLQRGSGHLVTIASAAGLLGVSRQTDYSASKHAAVGFDESLRVELARTAPGVRTTVVCPFFINTGMFDGVRTRVPWLLPILDQQVVAERIAKAIDRDEQRITLPAVVRLLPAARILPTKAFDGLMNLLGVNVSMEHFTGRTPERQSA